MAQKRVRGERFMGWLGAIHFTNIEISAFYT